MKRALVNHRVDRHALPFLVIAGEVLRRRDDLFALDAFDIRHGHAGGEVGVFGEAFEVAAAKRRAVDVDARPEQHVAILGAGLVGQRDADTLHEIRIPTGSPADGGGEAGGAVGSYPVRAVAHLEGRNAEPLVDARFHVRRAGQLRDLLFERHAPDKVLDTFLNRQLRVLVRFHFLSFARTFRLHVSWLLIEQPLGSGTANRVALLLFFAL